MKIASDIQNLIDEKVLIENEEREPSGRLAAGKLGWPEQWWMLWYHKVPQKPLDAYTLRKFQRGKDVENRIVEWVKPDEEQKEVSYRNVIGFADMVIDGKPYEVKSVTNMAFKHIQKEGVKPSHRLQAELYAKGIRADTFYVCYVASDDYRVLTFEEKVTDEVDKVIDRYEELVKIGTVPAFEAKEKWQGMANYNAYPEWMKLTEKEIAEKLKTLPTGET